MRTGTVDSPGTLAGTCGDVVISGTRVPAAGSADVTGNVTVSPRRGTGPWCCTQAGGNAAGQCGFGVMLASPSPGSDVDVPPTDQPAAVPLQP